ncbi:transposase [Micrococcus luteus]|uniref:transposase n=2 Tax=Micrococcus TaxID=1269 RepID=UPI001AE14160|nr:transposase [Micrococcus luteus]QTP18995.1 transposase [Micrococcus luteus]
MPAAYPREFRQDVVAIARKGQIPIAQVAKDFGIAESCLRRWLAQDDVEAGIRPGITKAENEELKALRCQGPLSSAHRRPVFLPAGGHQNCPLVASWFARLGGGAGHRDGISSVA